MDKQCLAAEESAVTKVCNENEPEMQKRTIKLTAKALVERLDSLQKLRKAKLNKAYKMIETITSLMQSNKEYESEVRNMYENFNDLCLGAKETHDALLTVLPDNEIEKHDIWFKAKLIPINEFTEHVNVWLSAPVISEGVDVNINDDVVPEDSVSNASKVTTVFSNCSSSSRISSTLSACIQAEAEKAALVARATALKTKHAIETQQEELRKKMEQLELDSEIAASTAKIAVLRTIDSHSKCSRTGSSHSKGKGSTKAQISRDVTGNEVLYSTRPKVLNPQVTEYVPMSEIPMDTARVISSIPTQSAGASCNSTKRSILMQPKKVLNIQESSTYQQQDLCSFTQRSRDNMTTSQAVNCLPSQGEPLYEILKRQEELTTYLVHQVQPQTLPKREIPIFDGNPLQYVPFIRAFEHSVEEKTRNKRDCLYFLEQFTTGQPRVLVQSCQHLDPEVGYLLAKKLLQEQFGDEFQIAAAYMERALSWPSLRTEDAQGLHAYSLFLHACCNIIDNISYMQELNMPSNMRTVVMKLPFKLRERWRERACEIMELNQGRAKFSHIVDFIERQAKMASDPVFGCIQDKQPSAVSRTFKGNSFATNVTNVNSAPRGYVTSQLRNHSVYKTNDNTTCLFCQENHVLKRCEIFKNKSQQEKLDFLKETGVCFSCLKSGHISREVI